MVSLAQRGLFGCEPLFFLWGHLTSTWGELSCREGLVMVPMYQSTNAPIYQSTNPPIHQSTNPPIHQSTNPPIHQSTNPPIHQSTNPINPPIHQSYHHSFVRVASFFFKHIGGLLHFYGNRRNTNRDGVFPNEPQRRRSNIAQHQYLVGLTFERAALNADVLSGWSDLSVDHSWKGYARRQCEISPLV